MSSTVSCCDVVLLLSRSARHTIRISAAAACDIFAINPRWRVNVVTNSLRHGATEAVRKEPSSFKVDELADFGRDGACQLVPTHP